MASLLDRISNRIEFSKKNGLTITGEPADEIIVYGQNRKSVKEETEKHAVFTFGRFNPPTTGHQKLIDAVKNRAETQNAEHHIFASHSQDKLKNPLPYQEKVGFMKKLYPKTNIHSSDTVKNVLDAAKYLQSRGVTHGTLVVGSDRVDELHNLLSKYNKHPSSPDYDPKKHFYIPHLSVVSAGHRDPDAQGVEGMSASKLRSHAMAGNFKEFSKGVPQPQHAQALYNSVRGHMGLKEQVEVSDRISNIQKKKEKTLDSSEHEDRLGQQISTRKPKPQTIKLQHHRSELPADMQQNPYESVIPSLFKRDTGYSIVNIGKDRDLKNTDDEDTKDQLKRRKSMKLFKAFREGMDGDVYGGSDKPSVNLSAQLSTPVVSTPVKTKKLKVTEEDEKHVVVNKNHTVITMHKNREGAQKKVSTIDPQGKYGFKVMPHSEYKETKAKLTRKRFY
jgi:hypothetical protein